MKNLLALLFLITFSFSAAGNTPKISLEKYIETWKDVAISLMHSHGVPASITLAQGILESGFGNSDLAVKANNHFGIKCHDWKGESFLKDDDKRNECFRKYKNAAQSFEDHSHFLTGRSRYAFLFDLDVTDYKGWAKGLKQAGYATNPSYDKRLIDLIERYDLDQYDKYSFNDLIVNQEPELQNKKDTQAPKLNAPSKNTHRSEEHTSELQSRPHLVCRLLLEKKKKKQTKSIRENIATIGLTSIVQTSGPKKNSCYN